MGDASGLQGLSGERAYIGLGANLGDARATLHAAIQALRSVPGIEVVACSPFYASAPVDAQGPDFINAVLAVQTDLAPLALLHQLQAVERAFGRQRPYRHAPRTLDLDLLMHAEHVIATPELTLPHPRLHQRAFVLRPLLDLVPGLRHPLLGPLAACLPATADQVIRPCA